MKSNLFLYAASLAIISATSAYGQNTEKTTEVVVLGKKLLPEKTTSANKTGISNQLTPQSIQVVPQEVIDDQHALTLSEATRNVAGVATDFGFNGETQPLLVLRGFPSTSMSSFGSMLGSSTYYLDGTKISGLPINMSDVKAIEVIKGPNSVLFGRGEPGGLVNVVSKGLRVKPGLSFEQTLGDYGLTRTYVEGSGAVNEDKTLLLGATATHYSTDSYRDFVEEKIDALGLRAQWNISDHTTFKASYDLMDHKYRNDYGLPAINGSMDGLPLSAQFNDAPELSSVSSQSLRLELRHEINHNWVINARAIGLTADMHEVDVTPYRFDMAMSGGCDGDGNPMCRYYYYVRPNGHNNLGQVTIDLAGKVVTGSVTHNLLFSAETYRSQKKGLTQFSVVSSVDIYNPVLGNTPKFEDTFVLDALDYVDYSKWSSLSVQDQIDFGNGLNLVFAVRQDSTEAIYAVKGSETNTVSYTSPRLGLVWAFAPNQSVYVQAQESLAANNGRDLLGNEVEPETAEQKEIGYKYQSNDGRLTANVSVYELLKKNRADFTFYYVTGEILTTGIARSRGLEVDVIGQITPKLSVIGSYAYTDTEVTKDLNYQGKALANVPLNSASLWASYELSPHWRIGGGAFYQGDRWGDISNSFVMPAYTRIDAMAAYDFEAMGSKASVQLNVNNLFDTRYYTGSHQFVTDWVHPGAPRTVMIALKMAY